jgi:hypothetical protein
VYQFVNVLVCQRLVLRIVLTAPVRVGHAHARGACTRVHVDVRMCARTDANACMRVHTQRTHTQTHTQAAHRQHTGTTQDAGKQAHRHIGTHARRQAQAAL